jgi:hypothetical protein
LPECERSVGHWRQRNARGMASERRRRRKVVAAVELRGDRFVVGDRQLVDMLRLQ